MGFDKAKRLRRDRKAAAEREHASLVQGAKYAAIVAAAGADALMHQKGSLLGAAKDISHLFNGDDDHNDSGSTGDGSGGAAGSGGGGELAFESNVMLIGTLVLIMLFSLVSRTSRST